MLKNKVIIINVHQEPKLSHFNNLRSFLFCKIPLSLMGFRFTLLTMQVSLHPRETFFMAISPLYSSYNLLFSKIEFKKVETKSHVSAKNAPLDVVKCPTKKEPKMQRFVPSCHCNIK